MTRDMDKKVLPAVKMGNFLSLIFLFFYFAVKPSENDEKCRKPNSFITPMTRDMDKKVLPAVKMGIFFVTDFSVFLFCCKTI